MDCKPLVTYAGDRAVFSSIEPGLVSGLPTEAVEWKRSYGRNSRSVYVEVDFEPFDAERAVSSSSVLQGHPVFHTFWTDVNDVDSYRQGVKDDIQVWQTTLKKIGVTSDWLVVVVETQESKKGVNKFPLRTTVLDRLKQDIGGKTPDRVVALIDPTKSDSRAAESMQALLLKFRLFFLQSLNKVLNKYEENIRSQREKRTESNWNFYQYFLMQEQLAFLYETLAINDESLIQYDELDALFTQFVLNANVGERPVWLSNPEITDWTGLSLDRNINRRLITKVESLQPSLLELRNYLFSRQAQLLLLCGKPWEVAKRTLGFLHNTVQELDMLELEGSQDGNLDCWVLLTCLEVLRTCERHQEGAPVNQYCLYTAGLWSYAREKLYSLGSKCGLLPGQTASSAQLHMVVSLTGGLQEDIYVRTENEMTNPLDRLKDSLSSNESFRKNYLEMSEIAISSFKTVGRIRSARLIGKELATFYISLGEIQKAASFLAECLKTFLSEGWDNLSSTTMLDLASCYRSLGDKDKYVRICAQIASCKILDMEKRSHYFDQMVQTLHKLDTEEDILVYADHTIDFKSCQVVKSSVEQKLIPGSPLNFSLTLESHLTRPLSCSSLQICLSHQELPSPSPPVRKVPLNNRKSVQRSPSAASSTTSVGKDQDIEDSTEDDNNESIANNTKLDIMEQLDYKQDKSLCAARLVCRNSNKVLKRKDSSGSILKDGTGQLERLSDYSLCLDSEGPVTILPGYNSYQVVGVAGSEGKYEMTQISIRLTQHLDFLHNATPGLHQFTVTSEPPVLLMNRPDASDLYAGMENKMVISLFTGSRSLVSDCSTVTVSCSRGMLARGGESEDYSTKITVTMPPAGPFETVSADVWVKAVLTNQKDSSTIEHKLTITDPWILAEKEVVVHFLPAFYTTFHLQTALSRKFLQILLFPMVDNGSFSLSDHSLSLVDESQLKLSPITSPEDILIVDNQCEAGYLWELLVPGELTDKLSDKSVKLKFSVQFKPHDDRITATDICGTLYESFFQFQDFLTLFTIQAKVDPAKGNEFCRAGTMCPMTVQLEQFNNWTGTSLYYEVLADQATWAVCGRQGAVVDVTGGKEDIMVEVMPLVGGYLPLPTVRLSKYIPADSGGGARLDPFSNGQVYNMSRSQQIHVLPPVNNQEFVSLP